MGTASEEDRARLTSRVFCSIINGMDVGVVVVRDGPEVFYANELARRIAHRFFQRASERSIPLAVEFQANRTIDCSLGPLAYCCMTAARPGRRSDETPWREVELASGDDRARYVITELTSARHTNTDGAEQSYRVILIQPEPSHSDRVTIFARYHRLTPQESRVLEGLMRGSRLSDLAAEFRVSITTIRSQLQAIFRKTETLSQTDLLRRVLSMPLVRLRDS